MAIPGWAVFKQAAVGFWNDNALSRGASIAYFTIFSLAPVLFIAVAVAGLVFGRDAARGAVVAQLSGLMGHHTASALQAMIRGAYRHGAGLLATGVGVITLLVTATSAFAEMQGALNEIWRAKPSDSTVLQLVRARLVSLGLVLTLGFVLLVSLVVSAALSALGNRVQELWPQFGVVLHGANSAASLLLIALLLAAIYKVLPDRPVAWRDAAVGAIVTALLFEAGKYLIGFYIGSTAVSSSYGAAGAIIVLLLWIYFTAEIFLFGAEIAHAYAARHGRAGNRGE